MSEPNPWYLALAVTCAILAGILLWGRKGHEPPLQQFYQENHR